MDNAKPAPINILKFTLDLREILSRVTVSGPENIHNMDLVLNGLAILHNTLAEQEAKNSGDPKQEQEEI